MPPIKKFQAEDIINTACQIIEQEGIQQVNARKIAQYLGCSVQPIFHNFATMEELMASVYETIYGIYKNHMIINGASANEYKSMGLAYITFAKEHPEFFKIIFMQETNFSAEKFIMSDSIGEDVIKIGQKVSGLSYDDQKKLHIKVWIFTHGIACLVATKTVKFTDEEISDLLSQTVQSLIKSIK